MKKGLLTILILLIIVIGGAVIYLKIALPDVDAAPNLQVKSTPERIANGKYLANHVTVCMDCHSERNWKLFSAPLVAGTFGKGGELFNENAGFPGTIYSKNITPFNLKNWTDGEIYRTITTGVTKSGEALFPVMPYKNYRKMDKEDIYDIIAYIRTLQPIENSILEHDLNFPVNFIVNTIPENASPTIKPLKSDILAYGSYLTNAAACIECHTPAEKGQILKKFAFSGGREFRMPNGILRTPNITSDVATGIGAWTEEMFVSRFKSYNNPDNVPVMKEKQINTIMPWTMYAGMDSTDLIAIFTYLKTTQPIKNKVVRYE